MFRVIRFLFHLWAYTRLLKNINMRSLSGSTQKAVPVNPVWPYTEAGASGQVGLASGLLVLGLSKPNPLRLFSLLALIKLATVWAEIYLSPPYSP